MPFQRFFSAARQHERNRAALPRAERNAMRLPRKLAALLLTAGTLAGITAAAVPARADTPTPYDWFGTLTPTGQDSGLCLEADPGPTFAYQVATQPCDVQGNAAQQWVPVSQGGGIYKFVNHAVGWCLDADSITNGGIIALWDCSANITNTRWAWDGIIGVQPLQSRISGTTGHCLDVPQGQVSPGLRIQLWNCNSTRAQEFILGEVILVG
jgi:hypothetical protein